MSNDPKDAPSSMPSRRFEGREDFRQLVRDALACAALEGWQEIAISDASFEEWPLGERVVEESLQAWSKSGRRFFILARNYDELIRRHARFVRWRGTWSHIVTAVACPSAAELEIPSAILSPAWALERRDIANSIGYCGSEPRRRVLLRELLNEWTRKSSPGFPSSTIGL